ncbi:MAG: hypothetical protein OEX12_00100 [Gammaproteobacteria bacterium]|nr:hypothetical protein [Gammaproteobacteria bacterium]
MPDEDDDTKIKDPKKIVVGDTDEATKLLIAQQIQDGIAESLKPIKENLDKAYKAKEEAEARALELENKQKERELKDLEEAGKHKEVYEQRLADKEKELEDTAQTMKSLAQKNIELTRDIEVRNALREFDFRNANASDMAFREVIGSLTQNSSGTWVDGQGRSVLEVVKGFVDNETNAFLLKPKSSSGSGTQHGDETPPAITKTDSLFGMKQADVLKLASEGKLPRTRR